MISNEHTTVGSNSYEKLKTFKYLCSLLTNQNYIQDKIKYRLKAGNSCYYSVQILLSSLYISLRIWQIKIYKTIILPVVLYGCETWSLTLREEPRLRVFENRIPRLIFGHKKDRKREWRMRRFIVRTVHLIHLGWFNLER